MSIAITMTNWVGQQISGVLHGGAAMPIEVRPAGGAIPSHYHITKYRIEPGDTLARIAKKFSVSVDDLTQANAISNPNLIKSGKSLYIPK